MKKGRPLYVEGRLQLDSWDDKNTGQKRSKLKVVGENFQFLGGREGGDGGGGSYEGGQSSGGSQSSGGGVQEAPSGGDGSSAEPEMDDDDIPF